MSVLFFLKGSGTTIIQPQHDWVVVPDAELNDKHGVAIESVRLE